MFLEGKKNAKVLIIRKNKISAPYFSTLSTINPYLVISSCQTLNFIDLSHYQRILLPKHNLNARQLYPLSLKLPYDESLTQFSIMIIRFFCEWIFILTGLIVFHSSSRMTYRYFLCDSVRYILKNYYRLIWFFKETIFGKKICHL